MSSLYFQNFPFRLYTLDPNAALGDGDVVTDLFKRVKFRSDILNSSRVYYPYTVQDGDLPETIAYKYYGSVDYFWIVCLVNDIIDPLRDWPKNYHNFINYIVDTYGSVQAAQATIHHYTKTISKTDSDSNQSSFTSIIDLNEYNSLVAPTPQVYTFSTGKTVTVTTTRGQVDCYTYEDDLNTGKRNILLLKSEYVGQLTHELETLMSQ